MAENHDVDLKYNPQEFKVTGSEIVWDGDDRRFTVKDTCPQCHSQTSFSVPMAKPEHSKGFLVRRTPPKPKVIRVYCECLYPHADRPSNAYFDGCGAWWPVVVT